MIEVPFQQLSPEARRGIVESQVLREGTDYGEVELSHEQKVLQLERAIQSGEAVIVYDEESETCTVMSHEEWALANKHSGSHHD